MVNFLFIRRGEGSRASCKSWLWSLTFFPHFFLCLLIDITFCSNMERGYGWISVIESIYSLPALKVIMFHVFPILKSCSNMESEKHLYQKCKNLVQSYYKIRNKRISPKKVLRGGDIFSGGGGWLFLLHEFSPLCP